MNPADQHHADIGIEQMTSGTSDAVLRDTLDRTPTVLASAQRAAHDAFDAARTTRGVPVERIEQDWATFCVRFRAAAPPPDTHARSMVDFFGRVAQLRVALQVRTHFRTIAEVAAADLAQTAARSERDRMLAENWAAHPFRSSRARFGPTSAL